MRRWSATPNAVALELATTATTLIHSDHRADRFGAKPRATAGPFCRLCAAAGANIAGAHITTTRDGYALDTFLLNREFQEDEDELRRADRISNTIQRLLNGQDRLPALLQRRRTSGRGGSAFTVQPEVVINNGLSERLTVVEVSGRDRPGLLYELTSAFQTCRSISPLRTSRRSARRRSTFFM